MLSFNDSFEILSITFIYLFIYNVSLIILFWTLQQFIINNFKNIYSFSDVKFNFFFLFTISTILFSLAGVPPFLGFFTKILILISLLNSNFFLLYFFFFALIFLGLYFYIQNIRFLLSSNQTKINYTHDFYLRSPYSYFFWTNFIIFFILTGFIFFDDIIFFFIWILI